MTRHLKNRASKNHALFEPLESRQLLAADLSGAFAAVPAAVVAGSRPKVVLNVSNGGTSRADGTLAVSLYAVPDGTAFDPATAQLLTTFKHGINLRPGATTKLSTSVSVSALEPAGNYHLFAVIDSQNRFTKSNETNNIAESSLIAVAAPTVDLVPSIVLAKNAQIISGKTTHTTARITITNSGNSAVSKNQVMSLSIAARAAGNADVILSQPNARINIGNLAPGASRTVTVPLVFPATLPAETASLVVTATGGSTLVESNTLNNVAAAAQPVTILEAAPVRTPAPPPVILTPATNLVGTTPFGATPVIGGTAFIGGTAVIPPDSSSPFDLTPSVGSGSVIPTTGFISVPSSNLIPIPALSGTEAISAGTTAVIPPASSSPFLVPVPQLSGTPAPFETPTMIDVDPGFSSLTGTSFSTLTI